MERPEKAKVLDKHLLYALDGDTARYALGTVDRYWAAACLSDAIREVARESAEAPTEEMSRAIVENAVSRKLRDIHVPDFYVPQVRATVMNAVELASTEVTARELQEQFEEARAMLDESAARWNAHANALANILNAPRVDAPEPPKELGPTWRKRTVDLFLGRSR